MVNSIKRLWSQIRGKQKKANPDEGPDLFEYALGDRLSDETPDEKKKKRKWIPILLFVVIPSSMGGGWILSSLLEPDHELNRFAKVYFEDGSEREVFLYSIESEKALYSPLSDQNQKTSDKSTFETSRVTRIDFLPDPEREKKDSEEQARQIPEDAKKFLGHYIADISGHRADFVVYKTKNGYVGAFLKFQTWGTGKREYLRQVRFQGDQISFVRSCTGQECVRIGSPNPIRQVYTGTIDSNHQKIKGTYKGGRNASQWIAIRKQ